MTTIKVSNDRKVSPSNLKIANKFESDTRTIDFDLTKVEFKGNAYLVLKYRDSDEYFTPLFIGESMSIPVKTFMSAKGGTYDALIAISTVEIGEDYDFSQDNPMFISNVFQVTVEDNFLSGTEQDWALTPAAQNYFDQLIALVEKVQSDLDSGAFNGNGIQSITKTGSQGLVDTYQITFTNGSTFDYQVTNGQNGQMPTITIQNGYWYINGVNTGQQAQGEQGEPGKDGTDGTDGVGIQSIQKTSTSGNVDTYTITYTNETTSTFTVTNGVTPNITIGTVTTLQPTEQATASITGTVENPVLNLGIPQGAQGEPGQGGSDNKLIGTVSKSENPSVTDSYNTELMNLIFYGKSTQVTTTGENKLGIGDFYNSTGKEKILPNGYSLDFLAGYYIYTPLNLPIGTYYATRKFSNSSLNTTNVFRIRDANNNIVSSDIATYSRVDDYTFKLELKNVDSPLYLVFNTPYGQQVSIYDIGVFEEYPFTYEIFTGGQPSPSPEYPQDITAIEQVSGFIAEQNLLNADEYYETYKNGDVYTTTNDQFNSVRIPIPSELIGKTLLFSADLLSNANITRLYTRAVVNGKSIDGNSATDTINYTNSYVIFTPETENDYVKITYGVGSGIVSAKNIMLAISDAQIPYTPYIEKQPFSFTPPQPLYSTQNEKYADTVNVESGQCEYVMKPITFNGSENWIYANDETNGVRFYLTISDKVKGLYTSWCEQCENVGNVQSPEYKDSYWLYSDWSTNNQVYFKPPNESVTTVDEFKQWLSENPINLIYASKTPTTQPIPQETLAILRALKSNNGVTNVICNAPVSFDYEQSLQIVIQNIWNAINNNTLSIETKG